MLNQINPSEHDMKPSNDLIARRIDSLPITSAERAEALAYVSAGEDLADALRAIAQFFQIPQTLKHSH